ncbi:hypothetical protein B0H13DRAFT_1861558 [Mycena leptocephala]|nr:hypothetical protein B0H13DRAFT_1861558 [Mycena leptocephala]
MHWRQNAAISQSEMQFWAYVVNTNTRVDSLDSVENVRIALQKDKDDQGRVVLAMRFLSSSVRLGGALAVGARMRWFGAGNHLGEAGRGTAATFGLARGGAGVVHGSCRGGRGQSSSTPSRKLGGRSSTSDSCGASCAMSMLVAEWIEDKVLLGPRYARACNTIRKYNNLFYGIGVYTIILSPFLTTYGAFGDSLRTAHFLVAFYSYIAHSEQDLWYLQYNSYDGVELSDGVSDAVLPSTA